MPSIPLYFLTVLIWGSSWIFVPSQYAVSFPASVAYRFILAWVVVLIICLVSKQSLRFSWRQHLWFLALGLFLFNLNFVLLYLASASISSGLLSVIFASVVVFNMILSALVFKQPISAAMWAGSAMGIAGLICLFYPQIADHHLSTSGILLALLGTVSASIGMNLSAWLQRQHIAIMPCNAWAMLYGWVLIVIYLLITGTAADFSFSPLYIGGLLYMGIIASAVGFWCFLTLVGRIGPGKAAYVTVLFPVVALLLSTVFEDYQWTLSAIIGIALALTGNALVLRR